MAHLIAAFKGGEAKQVIFKMLIAVVYFIGGTSFLTHPIMGVSTLTLLLAGVILAEGVLEIISYFRMKGEGASGWVLFNGIVTILLGCLIWFQWPSSTVWAIGILVGVNLLMTGITRLMFGLAVRRVIPQTAR